MDLMVDAEPEQTGRTVRVVPHPCQNEPAKVVLTTPARERSSNQMSNNRHRQRWTPADTHGRSVPSQACCEAGSPVITWLRDKEAVRVICRARPCQ
jgi:hypothetical protein